VPSRRNSLELAVVNAAWLDGRGRPLRAGQACLAVPADEPYSIRLRNDPEGEATLPSNHNVSIYADATAGEELFYGDLVFPGQSVTYRVSPLATGVYLFRCDTHPNNMWGVLSVE
jgi:hypothetical protein